MLRLEDDWVWDSWVADDGERYHLFFLKAPRALEDAGRRHIHARIGHASSTDLREWDLHDDALLPGEKGTWDDLALWTGSVARGPDGVWRMYYTALSNKGHGLLDQRVGVVESDDLCVWRRALTEPAVEVDGRWYKTLDVDPGASETWRDPFVFADPEGDGWHMNITARVIGSGRHDDGVVAHAVSQDMLHWEVLPPLSKGGTGFGQIEVAQARMVEGQPVLVFTCHPDEQTVEHKAAYGSYCTWSVVGDSVLGPWDIAKSQPFVAEPDLFAAPLIQQRDGSWVLVGFRNLEPKGVLSFEILDPIPVQLVGGALQAVD